MSVKIDLFHKLLLVGKFYMSEFVFKQTKLLHVLTGTTISTSDAQTKSEMNVVKLELRFCTKISD